MYFSVYNSNTEADFPYSSTVSKMFAKVTRKWWLKLQAYFTKNRNQLLVFSNNFLEILRRTHLADCLLSLCKYSKKLSHFPECFGHWNSENCQRFSDNCKIQTTVTDSCWHITTVNNGIWTHDHLVRKWTLNQLVGSSFTNLVVVGSNPVAVT